MEYCKDNQKINYDVIFKNNKNMYLRIKENWVIITAPFKTPITRIEKMIDTYFDSIITKIGEKKKIDNRLFGQKIEVKKVLAKRNNARLEGNILLVSYTKDPNKPIDDFYKEVTKKETFIILEENKDLLKKYDLFPTSFSFKKMKTRWGSCKCNEGRITINSLLGCLDKVYLEYVIAHELAHLKHANHSKEFYDFLAKLYPNYKKIRSELKKYSL